MPKLSRTSTSYPVRISEEIKRLYEEFKQKNSRLFFYQWYIPRLFDDPFYGIDGMKGYRGMLIYHETGVGKTTTGANLAIQMMKHRDVILLMPKGLQSNFRSTMERLMKKDASSLLHGSRMRFISADAHNSGHQLHALGSLDGKTLIIDEAHNFFKSIINSGNEETNARVIYDLIMRARNLRLVFLTATPITKDPFELVPCMNMLQGGELLPASYEAFYSMFVKDGKVHNRGKLQNRLLGYVSHISYTLRTSPGDNEDRSKPRQDGRFPEDLGNFIISVEMGEEQYTRYLLIREKEDRGTLERIQKQKNQKKRRELRPLSLPSAEKGSTYYIESRMLCNYASAQEYKGMEVSKMPPEAFDEKASPKMMMVMKQIEKEDGLSVVFSHFVGVGGLEAMARYLEIEGYEPFLGEMADQPLVPRKRYALFAGSISQENRDKIKRTFNLSENKYGSIIKVILLSQVGAEGLSLHNVRVVHILEPYWYWSRIEQIRARAIRLGSHNDLPIEERDVKTFIYVSAPNKKVYAGLTKKEDFTIEQRFMRSSISKHRLIVEFLSLLKSVSVECIVNGYGGCRICHPDDVPLFSHAFDAALDLQLSDPCKVIEEEGIEAEKIEVDGIEYFYTKDPSSLLGYRVYRHDEEERGFIEISQSSEEYRKVIKAISPSI